MTATQRTSVDDLRSIRADLERWRDETADPREARAAVFARIERADNAGVRVGLLELDDYFFDVIEADTGADDVEWRAP